MAAAPWMPSVPSAPHLAPYRGRYREAGEGGGRWPHLPAALRAHLGRPDPDEGAQRHNGGERGSMVE
eukprot:scaffold34492_cov60-Phaeocystis_antarctica.AAC.1